MPHGWPDMKPSRRCRRGPNARAVRAMDTDYYTFMSYKWVEAVRRERGYRDVNRALGRLNAINDNHIITTTRTLGTYAYRLYRPADSRRTSGD